MKRFGYDLLACLVVCAGAVLAQPPAGKDLLWAFPVASAVVNKPPSPVLEGPQHIAGSTKAYTQQDMGQTAFAIDWFPGSHQPMPKIVRDGTANGGFACGACHLANGRGHPESADLTGLSVDYFVRTMAEFRSGVRTDPVRMSLIAKATSEEDVREAAAYFAAIKTDGKPWTKIVPSATVPKTYLGAGRMRFVDPDGGAAEPIGNRIITVPQDVVRVTSRDPRIGFIAYVPPGSIEKGKALASGAGGKTLHCALCHGPDLKGAGDIPPLAGTHPIYVARQLYDFKSGGRSGPFAELMKPVVANLTDEDIVDLSAYVASLER